MPLNALNALIFYYHTGRLELTEVNALSVLKAVDFLQLSELISQCVDFIAEHLFLPETILAIKSLFHNVPTLVEKADKYMQVGFFSP